MVYQVFESPASPALIERLNMFCSTSGGISGEPKSMSDGVSSKEEFWREVTGFLIGDWRVGDFCAGDLEPSDCFGSPAKASSCVWTAAGALIGLLSVWNDVSESATICSSWACLSKNAETWARRRGLGASRLFVDPQPFPDLKSGGAVRGTDRLTRGVKEVERLGSWGILGPASRL